MVKPASDVSLYLDFADRLGSQKGQQGHVNLSFDTSSLPASGFLFYSRYILLNETNKVGVQYNTENPDNIVIHF